MRWGISLSFHLQLLKDVGLQHATISQTTCRHRLDMAECLKWHWMPAFKPLGCFPIAGCYPKESFSWTLKGQEGRGYDSFFSTSPSGSHWWAQNSQRVKQKMAFSFPVLPAPTKSSCSKRSFRSQEAAWGENSRTRIFLYSPKEPQKVPPSTLPAFSIITESVHISPSSALHLLPLEPFLIIQWGIDRLVIY